jgi:hypothetical protein
MVIRLVVRGYFDGVYFCPSPMPKEKPLLKIRVSGPAIKSGHIPIPLLVNICTETQNAVNRQAAALQGRRSLRPGPITKVVAEECTLELVGLRKGSTTLNFAPVSDQQTLPGVESWRAEAIHGVAIALKSLGRKRGKPEALDLGLVVALHDLSLVLDKGITKLQLIVPRHNGHKNTFVADLTPEMRPRIDARLQQSLFEAQSPENASLLEGTIEITEGKARITPLFGSPISFSFDKNQVEDVYHAVHKPAKAKVDPKTHKLRNIEVEALAAKGDFFTAKTIDQLTAEQGAHPVTKLEALSGVIPDEDIDEFIAEIYQDRTA